ncbi:MAG: DUF1292 domain-containing protein [Ruminococcaceae bacterium]|nr:DUF1292 domain-containing protein [Oscillospiraceae bacterium]
MAENEIFENEEVLVYTLTDDEGNENDFELLASVELDGKKYCALIPYTEDEEEPEEYIVLRVEKSEDDPEEEILVSIDDDEEFDRVADIFDDEFADIDYDMAPDEE